MLSERWRAKRSSDMVGIDSVLQEVRGWLSDWRRGSAMLLHGPPGCGKTVLAHALAADTGRDIIAVNEPDDMTIMAGSATQTTLVPRQRLVLVNDIDGMAVEDRSIVAELLDALRTCRWPVIITAIDPWDPSIRTLRQRCVLVQMRPLTATNIYHKLRDVVTAENIKTSSQLIRAAAATASGDMRAGLNYLQLLAAGADGAELTALDRARNPFELLAALFKSSSLAAASQAINDADMDMDSMFAWIESNILVEWQGRQAAPAFELLSNADLMRRRNADAAKAVLTSFALLKGRPGWSRYGTPERHAIAKQFRERIYENESKAMRLAPVLHCSKAKVRSEHLPYMQAAVKAV